MRVRINTFKCTLTDSLACYCVHACNEWKVQRARRKELVTMQAEHFCLEWWIEE